MKINLHDIATIVYAQGAIWWAAILLLVILVFVGVFGIRVVALAIPRAMRALYSKTKKSFKDVFTREEAIVKDEDEDNPFRGE